MSFLEESKKNYLFVVVTAVIVLSCIYWMFFDFKFSSLLVYVLAAGSYITMYRVWLKIFEKKEHLLFHPMEKFAVMGMIFLSFVLTANAYINSMLLPDMFYVYLLILFIFVFYYIFRLKKQKKSPVPLKVFSSAAKILTAMCGIFLIFDLLVFFSGKFSLQLILYLPFLFLILSFIVCVYKKFFKFNSFSSLILFFNIYIMATLLLVLNFISFKFFSFTVITHFIIFAAAVFVMMINSAEKEDFESFYSMEFMALILLNVVLIFISLNNLLPIRLPDVFISYLYFVSIIFISFLGWENYKIL